MGSQGSRCVAPPISEQAGSEQMVLSAITAAPEIRWCMRVCLCVSGHETDSEGWVRGGGGQWGHWGKFTSAWIIRAERMPEWERGGDTSTAEEARQEITKPSPNERTNKYIIVLYDIFIYLFYCHPDPNNLIPQAHLSSQEEQFWLLLWILCGPNIKRLFHFSKMPFCVMPNNAPYK